MIKQFHSFPLRNLKNAWKSEDINHCFHLFLHSDLKQVLVWEVVAGIDLEDEDVVDSSLSPSVRVDAQQEEELDQQEAAPVDPHQRPHVLVVDEHSTW